jgi:transcription antitermination factor NusG
MARRKGWVAVELSSQGEKNIEEVPTILRDLLNQDSVEIFMPVYLPDNPYCKEKVELFAGYIFCKADCAEDVFFSIEEDPHFRSILTTLKGNLRHIDFVVDTKIKSFQKSLDRLVLKKIKEGDFVEILDGTCRHLRGDILNVEAVNALVSIQSLKSTNLLIEIPLGSLKKLPKRKKPD